MSVINKMLRDLEQQQQQRSHGPLVLQGKKPTHWLPWLAIPLALLAGWCGQAWFAERSEIDTSKVVGDSQIQHSQLSPLTVAEEVLQKTPVPKKPEQLTTTPATLQTTQAESPATAVVNAAPVVEPVAPTTNDAKSAVAEATTAVAQLTPVEIAEPEAAEVTQAAVQPEWQEERDWQQEEPLPTTQPAKPRSLAIEKVELSPAEQQAELVQQARKAESAGQITKAVQLWHSASVLVPGDTEPYLQQARLWQLQANVAAAEQALQQGIQRTGAEPAIAMSLAALLVRQQRWQEVLSVLNAEPDISLYADFYALKATALQKTSQHAQAVSLFQQLARLQPEQARWWLGMALSFDALMQPAQALQAYRQAEKQGNNLAPDSLNFVRSRITDLE